MEYVPAKTIVTRTKSTAWFGIDYNMNIYRGCCHGCIYCDSRSACYQIDDFDTVRAKKDALSSRVEPGVCPSSGRFEAVKKLSEAGIFTGILLMPVLPFLEDNEENVVSIVKKAHEAGAKFIYAAFGMTTRERQREYEKYGILYEI